MFLESIYFFIISDIIPIKRAKKAPPHPIISNKIILHEPWLRNYKATFPVGILYITSYFYHIILDKHHKLLIKRGKNRKISTKILLIHHP